MPECLTCSSPDGLPATVYIQSGLSNVRQDSSKIYFTRHFREPTTYYICDTCFNKEKKTRLGFFFLLSGFTIVLFIFSVWMLFVNVESAAAIALAVLGGLCISVFALYKVIEDPKNIRSELAVKDLRHKNSVLSYFTPKHYMEFKRSSDKIKSRY